jgi:hypothetical protein
MGFKKGQPRPANAGRKKGTPNRKTQDLLAICERLGVNPFESMVQAAQEIIEPEARVNAWEKVCQYILPKRKAVEIANEDEEEGFRIIVEDYTK